MEHTCDYCGSQLNRKVFCSSRHKVAWHRANPETKTVTISNKVEVTNSNKKVKLPTVSKICPHGIIIGVGSCKKGCQ